MKHTSVVAKARMPGSLHRRLVLWANRRERSVSWSITHMVTSFLAAEAIKSPARVHEEPEPTDALPPEEAA